MDINGLRETKIKQIIEQSSIRMVVKSISNENKKKIGQLMA